MTKTFLRVKTLSPLQESIARIRAGLPSGTILFYRLGDFLECFGSDAVMVSKFFPLTLTRRQEVPMAGIPFHATDHYTRKLVQAGYVVAVAEETPGSLRTLQAQGGAS